MAELAEIWSEALPNVKEGVTGVGVWTALNNAKPIALENGTLVLGLPHELGELSGHLKLPATKRLIENNMSELTLQQVTLRVIDGITQADWEVEKRRDAEKARLNEQSMAKMRAEMSARSNWEGIYEQLGRRFASVANKSLPQNRARFYEEAVSLVAEARREMQAYDELAERNFARCIERLAHYAEVPSTIVGLDVLRRAAEL